MISSSTLWNGLRGGLLALGLTLAVAACDTTGSSADTSSQDTADVNALAGQTASNLNLSDDLAEKLKASFAAYEGERSEAGFLWRVSDDLQAKLTDSEFAELQTALEQRPEAREGRRGKRGFRRGGRRGGPQQNARHGGERGAHLEALAEEIDLTDEQQEQLKAIHQDTRAAMQELRQARRDGSMTPNELREQAMTIREQTKADVQAVLTPEQQAELEARREAKKAERQARREESQAIMAEVLELTAEQQDALDALRDEAKAERKAVREQIQSGNVDREALRTQREDTRDTYQSALADILTEDQYETVVIHHALAKRLLKARHAHRAGRFGGGPGVRGMQG